MEDLDDRDEFERIGTEDADAALSDEIAYSDYLAEQQFQECYQIRERLENWARYYAWPANWREIVEDHGTHCLRPPLDIALEIFYLRCLGIDEDTPGPEGSDCREMRAELVHRVGEEVVNRQLPKIANFHLSHLDQIR